MGADPREVWSHGRVERLLHDVRYAVRVWLATPGLSIVAVLTMALGIGASTALVGQVRAVFWTPLAVQQPQELRQLAWAASRYPYVSGGVLNVLPGPEVDGRQTFGSFSYTAYEAVRRDVSGFSDLACWGDFGEARPVAFGELGFGTVQFVSGNLLSMLGVVPTLGRVIRPEDDGPETWAPVAVLGHDFWQRRFGGSPQATQQTLKLNGQTFAIIGVLPETFSGLDPATAADVMVPMGAVGIAAQSASPLRNQGFWNVCRIVGRLRQGVPEERARSEVDRTLAAVVSTQGVSQPYDPPHVYLTDGAYGLESLRRASSIPLIVLIGGVGALLLAACANIAGLLMARGESRAREIATRLALGAPRRRVVRQLVTESLVLSSIGGVLGVALAFGLSDRARAVLSQFLPTLFGADRSLSLDASPDVRVLGFALFATIGAGLLFGLAPALRSTRLDLISTIRQAGAASAAHRRWTGGRLLVAAQTALAVMLLATSAMFFQTLQNLRSVDLGFAAERLLYARVEPRSGNLPRNQRAQFFEQAIDRLSRLPGVVAASAATPVPFGGDVNVGASLGLFVCEPLESAGAPVAAQVNLVAPGYFRTLDVDILLGRDFTWADAPTQTGVPVIVNASLATAAFVQGEAVGRFVRLAQNCDGPPGAGGQGTVIGVAEDVRSDNRTAAAPAVYWPLALASAPTTLLVRTSGPPSAMITTVRKTVTEINPDIPTFSEAPFTLLRDRALRRERLLSSLLGAFAVATALLAALGLYGMLSYQVSRRRAEIGIRMAIGADAGAVARLVITQVMAVVLSGMTLGLVAAFMVSLGLRSMLYGISPGDPLVIFVVAGGFTVVAAAAAALPVWSAIRTNPLLTLRQ